MRVTLKKPHSDGTIAVDMDPLSLRCRLATSVPPSRFHTVEYAGVLAVDVLACPTCQGRMKLLARTMPLVSWGSRRRPFSAGSERVFFRAGSPSPGPRGGLC